MQNNLLLILSTLTLLFFTNKHFGQAPNLGTASSFALFTSTGAFGNISFTNISGDIGSNEGALTGFPPGTIDGLIHMEDFASAQAATDVAVAYSDLSGTTCGTVIGTTLGNGQVLIPGIYCQGAASTLNGNLTLDGQGDPDALFIIKIGGALSTSIKSNVILINSASLCNVYWQVNGAFDLGDSSVFKGTLIANGAISILENSSLSGRGLSIAGAVSLHNNIVIIGVQPIASIISADGAIIFNTGDSVILSGNSGGVWNNDAATPSITIKTSGDYFVTNTTCCDSITSNHILVSVSLPVELLSFIVKPAGVNVQIDWTTASETNNDYFTVSRSKDGISFEEVLKINGAGNSNILLHYSTIDCNPNNGISYYRLKQTDFDGKFIYSNIESVNFEKYSEVNIYPNPFSTYATIVISDTSEIINYNLCIYNNFGAVVINTTVLNQLTTIDTSQLPSGIYFYKVANNVKIIHSGILISQK